MIVCTLVLGIVLVLVLVPVCISRVLVLALRVSSARVLRVPCMVCVLRGSLVQCTLVVLVAERLVVQLRLVTVHIASPLLSPRTNT